MGTINGNRLLYLAFFTFLNLPLRLHVEHNTIKLPRHLSISVTGYIILDALTVKRNSFASDHGFDLVFSSSIINSFLFG